MTLVPPFLSLPQALVQLLSEENISITLEEASQYLAAREAKKPPGVPIITGRYISEIAGDVELPSESMEITLLKDNIRGKYFIIPPKYRDSFPPKTQSKEHERKEFTIYGTDGQKSETHIEGGYRMPGITWFFNKNKQLKEGDKVYIDIIEPKKQYRLRRR